MEFARIVRTEAALDSVERFMEEIRKELGADSRPDVLDELLGAATNEILFIRANLLETVEVEQPEPLQLDPAPAV